MAAETDATRIEGALKWLGACVEDLETMVPAWDDLPDGERTSFTGDWRRAMTGDVRVLADADAAGRLTPDQRNEFAGLLARIERHAGDLERLGLARPAVWSSAT